MAQIHQLGPVSHCFGGCIITERREKFSYTPRNFCGFIKVGHVIMQQICLAKTQ